jgi:hypothetical protein
VAGRNGELDPRVVEARIEKITGVSKVHFKEKRQTRNIFEVESVKDKLARGDLARAVVEAGWDLNELRSSAMSLEEVFLQLTGDHAAAPAEDAAAKGANK